MEMSIDEATLYMELYKRKLVDSVSDLEKDIEAYDIAIDIMHKYKARLKTEMLAMLKELLKEFENLDPSYDCNTYYAALHDCSNLLQQKINELREGEVKDIDN